MGEFAVCLRKTGDGRDVDHENDDGEYGGSPDGVDRDIVTWTKRKGHAGK